MVTRRSGSRAVCAMCAGVTLNRNLFETALRYLLVDSAEYTVQFYEGSGSHWKKTRRAALPEFARIPLQKSLGLYRGADMG